MEGEERIIKETVEKTMQKSYIDYSMSVIVSRALPDARDGLKPVHRKIMYAMYDMGLAYNRPHKKSATVVGEVLGHYHPHGDSSAYDAMVRMGQPFSLRYPLIDGQGNFGSVDGDVDVLTFSAAHFGVGVGVGDGHRVPVRAVGHGFGPSQDRVGDVVVVDGHEPEEGVFIDGPGVVHPVKEVLEGVADYLIHGEVGVGLVTQGGPHFGGEGRRHGHEAVA